MTTRDSYSFPSPWQCSFPFPFPVQVQPPPKATVPLIYGRLTESALRKHDFHVICIQIVWLTAKLIFALPPAAGSPVSILDWSLFICIGSLPVAPECCVAAWSENLGPQMTSALDLSAQCPQLKTICNLLAARGTKCNCWCWHILCDAHRFAE